MNIYVKPKNFAKGIAESDDETSKKVTVIIMFVSVPRNIKKLEARYLFALLNLLLEMKKSQMKREIY